MMLKITNTKTNDRMRVLFALVKGARRSDRDLSRVLGLSVPFVARKRQELEQEGFIQGYTVIPDFKKLGFGINAFTLVSIAGWKNAEHFESLRRSITGDSHVVFVGLGEGLGANCLIVSLHEDYDSYMDFIGRLRSMPELCRCFERVQSFMMSTGRSQVVLPFSLRGIEKLALGLGDEAVRTGCIAPVPVHVKVKVR
jgi:DNA-binding Lrp family transcriptional regulator